MKLLWLPIFISITNIFNKAFHYSVRCNKKQSSCQIKTKRLTIGDYVGILEKINFCKPLVR